MGPRHVKAGAIGPAQLQGGSVGATQLQPGSVGAASLGNDSVGTAALQTDAVGSDELAGDAVDSAHVKDGSLGADDLAFGVSPRLFAHVSSSGVLGENAGVVSAGRTSKGIYYVDFNRDLRGCVAVSSVGFGFGPGVIGAGATSQPRMNLDNDASKVGITVYRKGWTFADVEDNDVSVIVAC